MPPLIYAFKRTGRIVTESNKRTAAERGRMREWNDAVHEYYRRGQSSKSNAGERPVVSTPSEAP